MAGDLRDGYATEESFLENFGMFLGVVSHHVADLCTPVHVGHKMNYRRIGSTSAAGFHRRFERDMARFVRNSQIALQRPQRVSLEREYFWQIARATYNSFFLPLEDLYARQDEDGLRQVTSEAITCAIRHTANVWHTVMTESGMCDRKWYRDPLV
jgi:hypothetical protein